MALRGFFVRPHQIACCDSPGSQPQVWGWNDMARLSRGSLRDPQPNRNREDPLGNVA